MWQRNMNCLLWPQFLHSGRVCLRPGNSLWKMKKGRTEQIIIIFFPPLLTSFLLVLLFLLGRSGLTETECSWIRMIGRGYVIEITFTFLKKRIEFSYVDGSAAKVFQPFLFFFFSFLFQKLSWVNWGKFVACPQCWCKHSWLALEFPWVLAGNSGVDTYLFLELELRRGSVLQLIVVFRKEACHVPEMPTFGDLSEAML